MNIINSLRDKAEIYSSHEKFDIDLYLDVNGKRVYLAEPDIVVKASNRVFVVEIELSNSPKHLFGVAFAIFSSNRGQYIYHNFTFDKKSLLLVVDSSKVLKRGSIKPKQINEVRMIINKILDFDFFNIVTDKKAVDIIQSWLKNDKGDSDICV